MSRDELTRAIEQPAQELGCAWPQALMERLVDQVEGRAGALPLLQFALQQLWPKHVAGRLDSVGSTQLIEDFLTDAADELFSAADARDQSVIRRAFLAMVQLGEGTADTRRVARLSEFVAVGENPEHVRGVLGPYTDPVVRLVTASEHQGEPTFELTHEALITSWGRLSAWLGNVSDKSEGDRIRGDLRLQRRLALAATEWLEGRGGLWRPPELTYLQEARTCRDADLTRPAWAFAEASNAAWEQEQQRARRTQLRLKLSVYGATALAVGLGAATWVAQTNLNAAKAQKQIAIENETRALVALSGVAVTNHRPVDALKLAVAAWPRKGDDTRPALEATLTAVSNVLKEGRLPVRVFKHDGSVSGAAFMKDEARILSWSKNTLRLWDAATGQPIGHPMEHSSISGVLVNTDQTRIISWSGYEDFISGKEHGDRTLRLWNATSGQLIGLPMHHNGLIRGALLSSDGTRILSWSDDHTLRLWDPNTAQQIGRTMRHGGPVNAALFSKDLSRIVSWSGNVAYLWDAVTGEQIGQPMRHETPIAGARNDSRLILSWAKNDESSHNLMPPPIDGSARRSRRTSVAIAKQEVPKGQILRVWSAATALPVAPPMHHDDETGGIYGARFTKDGTRILSWAYNTLRLWQSTTGQPIGSTMRQEGPIGGALFTSDETRILSWSNRGTLAMWEAATGRRIGSLMEQDAAIDQALFSKDEKTILSWSHNSVRLWKSLTGEAISPPMKHGGRVNGAAFSKKESRILSWSEDGTLRLWNTLTGQPIGPPMYHDRGVNGALFNKDGSRILSWSSDGTVSLWDCITGEVVDSRMSKSKNFGAVFAEDYHRIVTYPSGGAAQVWDVATDQPIGELIDERWSGPVIGSPLTKNKTRIVSWSRSGTLRVWDIATGRPVGQPMMMNAPVANAMFNKDQTQILSWSDDGRLRLWNAATGQQIGETMKHGVSVTKALFNRSETRVLSWSDDDGTLKLWDAATGQAVGEIMKNEGQVLGALFSHDDTRIFSWSFSALRLWNAATGVQVGKQMNFSGFTTQVLVNGDSTRAISLYGEEFDLWDIATTALINSHMRHNGRTIYGAMFNKAGTRVLSWSVETLQLWDATTGHRMGSVMNQESRIGGALFTRDETQILSWSIGRYADDKRDDGKEYTLRLWDAATQRQIGATMHHDSPINGAMFGNGEARIVSWSNDNILRLWDVATTKAIGRPFFHGSNDRGASFNKDQTRILPTGAGSKLLNIDWPHGNLLELACKLLPDHEVTSVSERYSVSIDPICAPDALPSAVDWSKIVRAPTQQ
jgi:WD40 repeat protein